MGKGINTGSSRSKVCGTCGNTYSSLHVCPECNIPLTLQGITNQSVNGDDNQVLQNTGTIHGDIHQERVDAPGNETARYSTEKTGEIGYKDYKGLLLQPRIAIPGTTAIILGVLNVSDSLSSILSFFGLTAAQISLAVLFSWIVMMYPEI